MDLHGWALVALYAAAMIAIGGGVLACGRFADSALLHNWASAYFVGQLVATTAVLTTGFLPWRLPLVVGSLLAVAAVVAVVTIVQAVRRGRPPWTQRWRDDLWLLLLLVVVFPQLLVIVQSTVPVEWDARSIWFFHGKALHACGGLDVGYFGDARYSWSHLDYPLHLPVQAAILGELRGHWDETVIRAFLLVDLAAFVRLLVPLLRARGYPRLLAIVLAVVLLMQGVPSHVFGLNYVSGLADYHYAMPLAMAVLALAAPGGSANAVFAAVMLARAAATKNEGEAYVAATVVGIAAWWLWQHRRERAYGVLALRREHARLIGLFAVLVLAPVLWTIWKRWHGIDGDLHLAERGSRWSFLLESLSTRGPLVVEALAREAWNNGTAVVLAAGVVLAIAARVAAGPSVQQWSRRDVVVAVAVLGASFAAFATYVLTPLDVEFHTRTSAGRVLFLPHLLVAVLAIFRLDVLVAAAAARPTTSA